MEAYNRWHNHRNARIVVHIRNMSRERWDCSTARHTGYDEPGATLVVLAQATNAQRHDSWEADGLEEEGEEEHCWEMLVLLDGNTLNASKRGRATYGKEYGMDVPMPASPPCLVDAARKAITRERYAKNTHRGFTNLIKKVPVNRPKANAPCAPARRLEPVALDVPGRVSVA